MLKNLFEDIGFWNAIILILYRFGVITDYTSLAILSFIGSSILAYREPIDDFIIFRYMLYKDRKLNSEPNPKSLLRTVFESTYFDYKRVRLKTAIYLIALFGLILSLIPFQMCFTHQKLLFGSLLIVALVVIICKFREDLKDLPTSMYAILWYIAVINKDTAKHSAVLLNYARMSLESGNWIEALKWLKIIGYPSVRIPKRILELEELVI
mgnify:CR=1 FL=1